MSQLFTPQQISDPAQLGGKGQGLLALTRRGAPVPDWQVLPAEVMLNWAADNGLSQSRLEAAWRESPAAWLALAQDLSQASVPAEILTQIQSAFGEQILAVRSSSQSEDGAQYAAAGLFESQLNVTPEQRAEAIGNCWLALFQERVWHYAHRLESEPEMPRLALILQVQINPRCAGVWFAVNPQGFWHESVLVAAHGLGLGVVNNQSPTETWIYNQLEREITCLPQYSQLQPEPILSEAEALRLQQAFQKWSEGTTCPQDLEWCLDADDRLWCLQSRPITGLTTEPAVLLDASNIAESYPGLLSPLTLSVVQQAYQTNFQAVLQIAGLSAEQLSQWQPELQQMVTSVSGRIYYNLNIWQRILGLLPGLASFNRRAMSEMTGTLNQALAPATIQAQPFWRIYPRLVGRFWRFCRHYTQEVSTIEAQIQQAEKLLLPVQAGQINTALANYQHYSQDLVSRFAPGLLNDLWLSLCLTLSHRLFSQAGGQESNWPTLLSGIPDLPSQRPVRQLLSLADALLSQPQQMQALQAGLATAQQTGHSYWPTLMASQSPWSRQVAAYRQQYGFRVANEFLLESLSFHEAPDTLLNWLLLMAQAPRRLADLDAQEALQKQAKAEIVNNWGQRWQRPLLRFALKRCQQAMFRREQIRLFRAELMGLARRFFNQTAQILTEAKCLDYPEQIFLLTEAEIIEHIQNGLPDYASANWTEPQSQLRAKLAQRSQQQESRRLQQPPKRLISALPAADFPLRSLGQTGDSNLNAQANEWQGLGCGGTQIEGEVLICQQLPEPAAVKGKILVVPATDPGWMLHLLNCSGLIAETGNLLSHAAILGRELGLPTVVGIPGILEQLQSGDWVRLNGQTGTLERLTKPES